MSITHRKLAGNVYLVAVEGPLNVTHAGEVNRLDVVAEEAHFVFSINDVKIAEADNDQLQQGEAGLSVMFLKPGEGVFEFGHFELRTP